MARKPLVAGNWKMNTERAGAEALARALAERVSRLETVDVVLCPPFPYLQTVAAALRGTPIAMGAQNMYFESGGAFTGEVSAAMLRDLGCSHVILGHSERRHIKYLAETDELINKKIRAALSIGLVPIVCVGELLSDRDAGRTQDVVDRQLEHSLAGLSNDEIARIVLAYEPVWAIGTGRNATPAQAQEVHVAIREWLARCYNRSIAETIRIQYGGSVKPDNAAALMAEPDVDGMLVGGASLKADDFAAIVQSAARVGEKA